MCPGDWGLGLGITKLGGWTFICSSEWCGLGLGLWSPLELWDRTGCREDDDGGRGWAVEWPLEEQIPGGCGRPSGRWGLPLTSSSAAK